MAMSRSGNRSVTGGQVSSAASVDDVAAVKRVLLAAPRGYCAGVERAVEAVERALAKHGAPVYVRKQIVHNLHVVRDLEAKGAIFVQEVDEVPEGAVTVLSAHGSPPAVYDEASRRQLELIDATCPLVTKVHVEARRFADEDRTIVLIGHAGHEEVEGTNGQAPDRTVLVQDLADAGSVELPDGRAAGLPHADDPVGRRDRRDRRGAARPVPAAGGSAARGHLLRDAEPPGRGEGAGAAGRRRAGDRLEELLELEPPRGGLHRARDARPTWSTTRRRSIRRGSTAR